VQPINSSISAEPVDFGPITRSSVCALIPRALDPATCAHIISAVTKSFEPAGALYPPSYRDNDRAVVDDPELAALLFRRLATSLPARVVDRHGTAWRLVGLNERFRFCRYRDGQCFRIHRDGAHAPTRGSRSLLTLQIYLDEGFAGGRTRFYDGRHGSMIGAVEARTGRAIVFDHELWHDGEPVTQGTKHVLRTDVIYERERDRRIARKSEDTKAVTILEGHTGYVFSLLTMRDGSLVSGSRDRTVRRWSRDDDGAWRCTHTISGHRASVLALAEPRPGVVWSASRDRTIREWDYANGAAASRVVEELDAAVLALAPLGDGVVAAGTAASTIVLIGGGRVLAGHSSWVWSLASLGKGLLASGSEDSTVRLWEVATGECIAAASPGRGPVHALAVLDDGTLAAGFADGHVVVYAVDRNRSALVPIGVHDVHDGEIYAICTLPAGDLVTAGEDERAVILRSADGARVESLPHAGFVRAATRLDDESFATASYDGCVRVWRILHPPVGACLEQEPRGASAVQGSTAFASVATRG
jgi:WD40 repeat protein